MYDYGECHLCGGQMEEKRVRQELWVKGKLIVVERVPAGVCVQCGEKIVRAEIGRSLAVLLEDGKRLRTARTMHVPIVRFVKAVA